MSAELEVLKRAFAKRSEKRGKMPTIARAPKTKPWTFELLGKHSVGVGRGAKATMPAGPGCLYDLLATFDDGHKQQMLAVNTCKSGTIKFSR